MQLEVLLLVRCVHRTLGVILLVEITLPIAHPTSLVLLHVLFQAQRWIAHSPRLFACTWLCPSPLQTIDLATLRILSDEEKEVVLRLLVVVNIHVNVVVVLVRQFCVTTNLSMLSNILDVVDLDVVRQQPTHTPQTRARSGRVQAEGAHKHGHTPVPQPGVAGRSRNPSPSRHTHTTHPSQE